MPLFDSNGRLKITLSAPTGSTSAGVSVYENGTLISSNVTNINFIDQDDSYATVATSGSSGVTVTFSHTPIMAVSGFRSDLNGVDNVHYFAPNWSTLTGSTTQNFMVACLYKRKYHDVRADIVSKASEGINGWCLTSPGNENVNSAFRGTATSTNAERQFGFPGDDKWIFAIANYSPGDNYIYVFVNGNYAAGVAWTPGSMNTNEAFMVGGQSFTAFDPSGSQYGGNQAILISAIAMRTSSYNVDYQDNYAYFQAVKEAGDLVGDSRFGWDHIWSVKRNTPGATWTAASGSINLIRHGSAGLLTVVTDSNPRWL